MDASPGPATHLGPTAGFLFGQALARACPYDCRLMSEDGQVASAWRAGGAHGDGNLNSKVASRKQGPTAALLESQVVITAIRLFRHWEPLVRTHAR